MIIYAVLLGFALAASCSPDSFAFGTPNLPDKVFSRYVSPLASTTSDCAANMIKQISVV